MARGHTDSGGMGLAARFALTTFGVLLVVGGLGGFVLATAAGDLADRERAEMLADALRASAAVEADGYATRSSTIERSKDGVERVAVTLPGGAPAVEHSYSGERGSARLVVPDGDEEPGRRLFGLVGAVMALMVVVASVAAWWLASQVARPLGQIVSDVRNLSSGNRRYRAKVKGGGEVAQLSRALDRMSEELAVAHEAEMELGLRERELEYAEQVREALLPMATPLVEGYDLGGMHLAGEELSGVFHDFIEYDDGAVGLLVCEVSGDGVPAALIGAIARTWLRAALTSTDDVAEAFARANRDLARDLRRGLVVTAMFARLDPAGGRATVACAGHRLPLVRTNAADGTLRVFQPEGVALGLDAGPVFERTLSVQDLEISPGDRLVLATSGVVVVPDMDGTELGEKGFFQIVHRTASQSTGAFLRGLRRELEARSGDLPREQAVSLVTVLRERA
ncbi:MAG: SpoIIE family protein phosphatase [Planctomycetota bacterium]